MNPFGSPSRPLNKKIFSPVLQAHALEGLPVAASADELGATLLPPRRPKDAKPTAGRSGHGQKSSEIVWLRLISAEEAKEMSERRLAKREREQRIGNMPTNSVAKTERRHGINSEVDDEIDADCKNGNSRSAASSDSESAPLQVVAVVTATETGAREPDPGKTLRGQSPVNSSKLKGYDGPARAYKLLGNSKLIRDILECNHFRRTRGEDYNVLWSNSHYKSYSFGKVTKYQKINAFPLSWEVTRKDSLARNINRMAQVHGKRNFVFMPECYVWPHEKDLVLQAFKKVNGTTIADVLAKKYSRSSKSVSKNIASDPTGGSNQQPEKVQAANSSESNYQDNEKLASVPWIVKPAGSSQGKGIKIITSVEDLPDDRARNEDNWIVERYIDNPLLLDGKKFDLRLYVAVTSFDPLKVYLHREGLVRLASEKYSYNYKERFSHLTNYSINKYNINNTEKSEKPSVGAEFDSANVSDRKIHFASTDTSETDALKILKLTIAEFNRRMTVMGVDTDYLWEKIEDLILKTLISVEAKIVAALGLYATTMYPGACFELFGFDVLVDSDCNPWLMEVNFAPSLSTDSPLDFAVKSQVVTDLFNLCGIRVETDSSGDSTTYAGAVGAKGNGVSFDRTAANKNLAEKVREQSTSVNSEKPKESVTVIDSVQREATEVDNLNDDSSRSSSHGSRKTGDGKFRKRLSKRNNRNANAKQCSPYLQQSTLLPPKSRPVSAMKKKGVTHPKHPRAVEHCGDGNDNQSSPKVQDQSLTQTTDCTEPIALPVTEEGEATSIENSTQMREKAIEQTRKTKESAHATINEQQYLANCYKNEPAACETAHESQDNNTISTDTQSSRGLEGIDVQQDRYHRKLITHSLLSELVGEERKVLSDFVSEISRVRLGGYKLLFPVDNKYAQYRRYFESERPNNAMLSRYMFALLHHKDIITLKYENITAPDASRQPKDDFMKDYSLRPAQAIDDNKKSISYERQSPLYEDSNFKRKPVMAVDNREDDSDMVQTATAPIVGTPKSLLQNRPLSRAGGKTQTSKIFRVDSTNKISAKEALGDLQVTRVEASVSIETLNNKWARSIGKSSNHGERNSNNLYAII